MSFLTLRFSLSQWHTVRHMLINECCSSCPTKCWISCHVECWNGLWQILIASYWLKMFPENYLTYIKLRHTLSGWQHKGIKIIKLLVWRETNLINFFIGVLNIMIYLCLPWEQSLLRSCSKISERSKETLLAGYIILWIYLFVNFKLINFWESLRNNWNFNIYFDPTVPKKIPLKFYFA